MKDIASELLDIQEQIRQAQQQLGRCQATKDALGARRQEIITAAKALNVEPKLTAIEALLAESNAVLTDLIYKIDKQLRK